ncbi:MAG: formate dehydrogenase accessory sulfurtransferase FdhD [Polyangiaceae bacterium]
MRGRTGSQSFERIAVRGRDVARSEDDLATEEPLEIRVEGPDLKATRVAVTMRTPGHDLELSVGFLRTEGLIAGREDVVGRRPPELAVLDGGANNIATVCLTKAFDPGVLQRNFYATSSCGICGKASIDQVHLKAPPLPTGQRIGRSVLVGLPDALRRAQALFDRTGGLHAAGLFDLSGKIRVIREDVGRHNALDKVVGRALLDGELPLHERVIVVSGRASFELVQKVAMAGSPFLCAVSAPSSLAVSAAERFGVTLVGFLRGDGFNVYAGAERIDLEA